MGRIKRNYYQSSFYHVCSRGNNRRHILGDAQSKKCLLALIARYQARYQFRIYAYVIMDNHFHMVLETAESANVSRVMQGILLAFSIWYRKSRDYVGHVWQGRFVSRVIVDERQFAENIRYVHENPVRAEMVTQAQDYPYSSAAVFEGRVGHEVDGLVISRYEEDAAGTLLQ